ncbi:hypothetical protein EGW08_000901 [Elysia chlorotica]|uniref:Uncharacterized protein n=1 Tax=Elysia chlorotica TaxID=188477 RepID=A0A433UBP4_ELYCH|nr:hypothetical protein EGW08_000901 [Elysia chlorotica]
MEECTLKLSPWLSEKCRKRALKYIHCRPLLVAVCTLVVIECACVLTELMVDLQGIKYRFESQEKEVDRFVEHLKSKYPQAFTEGSGFKSVRDLVHFLQHALPLWPPGDVTNCRKLCPCTCAKVNSSSRAETMAGATGGSSAESKGGSPGESSEALRTVHRTLASGVKVQRSGMVRRSVYDKQPVTRGWTDNSLPVNQPITRGISLFDNQPISQGDSLLKNQPKTRGNSLLEISQ